MTYTARIIHPSGTIVEVPETGEKLSLKAMQTAVGGGSIELINQRVHGGDVLANEDGLSREMPYNPVASRIFGRQLVGPILLLDYQMD